MAPYFSYAAGGRVVFFQNAVNVSIIDVMSRKGNPLMVIWRECLRKSLITHEHVSKSKTETLCAYSQNFFYNFTIRSVSMIYKTL